jgi:hypothetical protein
LVLKSLYLVMRHQVIIVLFLCLSISCSRHRINYRLINRLAKCQDGWQYFKLDHQVRGKIIYYERGYCGFISLNSVTIITTSARDTIRVLELTCGTKVFNKSDSVLVNPVNKPNSAGTSSDVDFTCLVKRTCYGSVTKVE